MKKISVFLAVLFICLSLYADKVIVITQNPPDDCLYNMAKTSYGNPSLWPALKDYNNIADERKIPNGKKIYIPDKSVAQALMNATTQAEKQTIINNAKNGTTTPPPANPPAGTGNTTPPPPNLDPDSPAYDIERAFGSKKL